MKKEMEYISDGSHNYLRVNCGEERKNSYQYKMITENTIRGLLPCRVRVVNGNTYLYYEIQSKQSLYYRYEIKEIDYESLKTIFFHLCQLGEELEKYFLDFNDVLFDEKYIFQNIETGETDFLFLPGEEKEKSFAAFMEYIVKRINHKDIKAVEVSYRLYDLSRQEHILVEEIKSFFDEKEESEFKTELYLKNPEDDIGDWKEKSEDWEWEDFEKNQPIKQEPEKAKMRDIIIPAALCIALTILICIKLSCVLTYGEETLLIAGVVLNIGLLIAYIVYRSWRKKKRSLEKSKREETFAMEKEDFTQKREAIAAWQYEEQEKEESYGETVFLEQEAENILCGLGKYEKTIIKLEHFPYSIGKLKEEADYVLKDNSISRLHARFYQENKSVYIMDLNSTNGTYKNGFRIPSNEKILLEEGDEIALGKIRFCYR